MAVISLPSRASGNDDPVAEVDFSVAEALEAPEIKSHNYTT